MPRRAWTPNRYRWQVAPPHPAGEDLARQLRTSPLIAQVLLHRGLENPDDARAFLNPKLTDLHDPAELPGAEPAAKILAAAIRDGKPIVIYGDYDVDGITGTAILHAAITLLGGTARWYVPHRLEEGYGVNGEALETLRRQGAEVLVTVDCGITAADVFAEHAGDLQIIVTDHHVPPQTLPDVDGLVHPTLEAPNGPYPNPHLCGAGVAFKLAWQLAREMTGRQRVDGPLKTFLLDATCLAALGTIADVVPLVGENRVLATFGLQGLSQSSHAGLTALLSSAKLTDSAVDAFHVGFVLAPRINAAGRMGHASEAIDMLTTTDADRARQIADELARQNSDRQAVERDITAQAVEMVSAKGLDGDAHRAIVLASEDWHGGVIGIVASRLVDRFCRPAVMIAINRDGYAQGSARSIDGFHMADALRACGEHLESFGGHAMAGGLKIRTDQIDAFTAAFGAYAAEKIDADALRPPLAIEAETSLGALGHAVVTQLDRMAPFGQGNRRPIVAIRDCDILTRPQRMGRSGNAVNLQVAQNGVSMRAVGFGMGDLADELVGVKRVDLAAQPVLNTFRGRTTVELQLRDVKW